MSSTHWIQICDHSQSWPTYQHHQSTTAWSPKSGSAARPCHFMVSLWSPGFIWVRIQIFIFAIYGGFLTQSLCFFLTSSVRSKICPKWRSVFPSWGGVWKDKIWKEKEKCRLVWPWPGRMIPSFSRLVRRVVHSGLSILWGAGLVTPAYWLWILVIRRKVRYCSMRWFQRSWSVSYFVLSAGTTHSSNVV